MRSCLVMLAILVVAGFLVLWFAVPAAAGLLAVNALRSAGLSGTNISVDVQSNPPPKLLLGDADTVRLRCTDANLHDLHAASMDVTFGGVRLFDRTISTVTGTLDDVQVATPDGSAAEVSRVTLDGDAGAAAAQLLITTDEAVSLAEGRFASVAGIPGTITLGTLNSVTILAAGRRETGTLLVRAGGLYLKPAVAALPEISLFEPGQGNPFTLTGVTVKPEGLLVTGTIDVDSLLAST